MNRLKYSFQMKIWDAQYSFSSSSIMSDLEISVLRLDFNVFGLSERL